ncbi:S26 family signal peptidase [Novipirellula herctigrandis]
MNCTECGVTLPLPTEFRRHEVPCWHCGKPHPRSLVQGEAVTVEGDLIKIVPTPTELQLGDIIAANIDEQPRVKRILGTPGDTISIESLRLLVNTQRLEDILAAAPNKSVATLPVDYDSHRKQSRWQPQLSRSGWTRSEGKWRFTPPSASNANDWLIYHHQAVYDQMRAAAVMDDVPINVDESRRMAFVDRMAIGITSNAHSHATVEVAFFIDGETRTTNPVIIGESTIIRCDQASVSHGNAALELADVAPMAVRVTSGIASFDELNLFRSVEYRLRKYDDQSVFPITLGPTEYYIVGDNVPASVDSRNYGPIADSQILGIIEP